MREFLAIERCDRCGAQAYHAAEKGDAMLLFCNHHHQEFEESLLNSGWTIVSDVSEAVQKNTTRIETNEVR